MSEGIDGMSKTNLVGKRRDTAKAMKDGVCKSTQETQKLLYRVETKSKTREGQETKIKTMETKSK